MLSSSCKPFLSLSNVETPITLAFIFIAEIKFWNIIFFSLFHEQLVFHTSNETVSRIKVPHSPIFHSHAKLQKRTCNNKIFAMPIITK